MTTTPRILLISLSRKEFFEDVAEPLMAAIKRNATLQFAEDTETAIQLIAEQPQPAVVLVGDEGLTMRENWDTWETVIRYVRQGGIAVVCGSFSSFVQSGAVGPFFARANLGWRASAIGKQEFVLNQHVVGPNLVSKLPSRYTQTGVFLEHVAEENAWYKTGANATWASRTSIRTLDNETETPVALAAVGLGKLGYVTDFSGDRDTTIIILSMCNLPL